MVDRIEFQKDALDLICSSSFDGATMIAACRAIFSVNYSDEIYKSDILDIFLLICDESDSIELNGFGRFNRIYSPSNRRECNADNNEVNNIFNFYYDQFKIWIDKFRKCFELR
jgi:hypothetical protein